MKWRESLDPYFLFFNFWWCFNAPTIIQNQYFCTKEINQISFQFFSNGAFTNLYNKHKYHVQLKTKFSPSLVSLSFAKHVGCLSLFLNMAISTNHATSLTKTCLPSFTALKVPSKPKKIHLGRPEFKRPSISCNVTEQISTVCNINGRENDFTTLQRPDSVGRFGQFGGKYVPETLLPALTELEQAFHSLADDEDFQVR
jgi:hypothetical protein